MVYVPDTMKKGDQQEAAAHMAERLGLLLEVLGKIQLEAEIVVEQKSPGVLVVVVGDFLYLTASESFTPSGIVKPTLI
jgi:hypothetical protein